MFMLRFLMTNRTFEFWLDTALETLVTIETVRTSIRVAAAFA